MIFQGTKHSLHFRPGEKREGIAEIEEAFTADRKDNEAYGEAEEEGEDARFWSQFGNSKNEWKDGSRNCNDLSKLST